MQPNQTILGIDIHSREYGYAVFESESYSYGAVKSLRGCATTQDKCDSIYKQLETIIQREQPHMLVWEQPTPPYQLTEKLQALQRAIMLVAAENKTPYKLYQPIQVREICSATGQRPTRQNMCQNLACVYPCLEDNLHSREKKSTWRYWLHLFNAVAVVHTHLEKSKYQQTTFTCT